MRQIYTFFLTGCMLLSATAFAQTIIVTDDATYTTGEASAVLDVKSTTKGFLLPRMTQAQRVALANPVEGLMVYQTDGTRGLFYFTNGAWTSPGLGSNTQWSLTGNSGTAHPANFLGTTDNRSLRLRTNNTERMVIDSVGRVVIGVNAFDAGNPEKLQVNTGATTSIHAIYAKGSIDSYFQVNLKNLSTGTQANSGYVASANNGTEISNFMKMGINGSAYVYQAGNPQGTGRPNDGFLINTGNDLYIANYNLTKSIIFLVGGTAASNEAMRIAPTENVGIATTNPVAKLDVAGTFKLGSSGTALNSMIKTSVTFTNNTSITYPQSLTLTVAVTGARANAAVIVTPRAALPNGVGVGWARVSADDTVQLNFTNSGAGTSGAQTLGTVTLDITIIQ